MTAAHEDQFKQRLREIYPYVLASPEREVGGFLIGSKPLGEESALPDLSLALRGVGAREGRSRLTFTHETWEKAHSEIDSRSEQDGFAYEIVGWHHSHPTAGIYLSEHDLFIHRNFFTGLRQIAVVVDPQRHASGVFVWQNGTVVPLYEESMRFQPRA